MSSSDYSLSSMDSTLAGLVVGGINWVFFMIWQAEYSISYTVFSFAIWFLIGMSMIRRYAIIDINFEDMLWTCLNEDYTKWIHKAVYEAINRTLNFLRSVMQIKCIWRTLGTIFAFALFSSVFTWASNLFWIWFLTNMYFVISFVEVPKSLTENISPIMKKVWDKLEETINKIPGYHQIEQKEEQKIEEKKD